MNVLELLHPGVILVTSIIIVFAVVVDVYILNAPTKPKWVKRLMHTDDFRNGYAWAMKEMTALDNAHKITEYCKCLELMEGKFTGYQLGVKQALSEFTLKRIDECNNLYGGDWYCEEYEPDTLRDSMTDRVEAL